MTQTAIFLLCTLTIQAQETRFRFAIESDMHYRDSKHAEFPIPFPFPPEFLPVGDTNGSLETVEAGTFFETSRFSLFATVERDLWTAHAKVDIIDIYDRNPTSSDREWDLDEFWVRYGTEYEPGELPTERGYYVKLGKFGKFERQDDRHLISYGLVGTSFNRFEDAGLEANFDVTPNFYIKASYTTGNPVFIRDPNALAGDNGAPTHNPFINPFPDPPLKSGIVLLYDAEIEGPDFDNAETGLGLGFRFGDDAGQRVFNGLISYYERDLADEVELRGTFYHGDLDLLRGVDEFNLPGLPINGRSKEELTATFWLYFDDATLFLQAVDSDVAGLERKGYEGEFSWTFKLPLWWAFNEAQIFPSITPVLRYSKIDSGFVGDLATYPAPSVWWNWKKLDIGVSARLYRGWRLTVEYADNQFLRGSNWEHNDEYLATVRWRMSSDQR